MSTGRSIKAGHAYILIEALDKTQKVFNQVSYRLNNLSSNFLFMGRQAAIFGSALSIPLISSVNSARDFSDEILFLQTKLRATDEQMVPLIAKIKELGRTTSYTATEVATAATALAQGGFSDAKIIGSLQAVLDMARGSRMELGRTAEIIVDTLTLFNMNASQANDVADKFFIAAKNGTIEVADLAQSFSYTAQSAAEMGFTLDETLSILSEMSKRMLKSTKAGTSLNQFITSLASNIEKVRDKIGIEVFDQFGEPLPALTVIKNFADAIRGLPTEVKLPLLEEIFNVRGMRTGTAIAAAHSFEGIFDSVMEMSKGMGIARESAIKMDSSIGGAIRRILSAFDLLRIEVGLSLESTFKNIEQTIIPVVRAVTIWSERNRDAFSRFAKYLAIIVGFATATLSLGIAFRVAGIAVGGLASAVRLISLPVKIVIGLVAGLATATLTLVPAFASATVAVISFTVALIAKAAAGIVAFGSMVAALGPELLVIAGLFTFIGVAVTLFVADMERAAKMGGITKLGDSISKLGSLPGSFGHATARSINLIIDAIKSIPRAVQEAVAIATRFVKASWQDTADIISITWGTIKQKLEQGELETAWEVITLSLTAIWKTSLINMEIAWLDFMAQIKITFRRTVLELQATWMDFFNRLKDTFGQMVPQEGALTKFLRGGKSITENILWNPAADWLFKKAKEAGSDITKGFQAAIESARMDQELIERGIMKEPDEIIEKRRQLEKEIEQIQKRGLAHFKFLEEEKVKIKEDLKKEIEKFQTEQPLNLEFDPTIVPGPQGRRKPVVDSPLFRAVAFSSRLPEAMERGTVEAQQRAFENQQTQTNLLTSIDRTLKTISNKIGLPAVDTSGGKSILEQVIVTGSGQR